MGSRWIRVAALFLSVAAVFCFGSRTMGTETVFAADHTGAFAPLPARYSLIDLGKKPKVRSQGNTGTCWAISAVSAIESDLLPENDLALSADHMSLANGFQITQEDGGDYFMIMSYLADWKGPVSEAEDPYGDKESPNGVDAAIHVQEIRMLRDMSRDQIKRMILRYGAAQSSLCMDRKRTDTEDYHYYNVLTSAYFDPLMEEVDHDILILGWDDTFSRESFRIKPPQDGAWICQNTWGDSFGENGVFYVSYEDRNLFRNGGLVYPRIEGNDNYARVYENDSLGWQGRQGYDRQECWFAGAFTAQEEEELAAVGLYSTGPGTECSIFVVDMFEGAGDLKDLRYRLEGMETPEDPEQNPEGKEVPEDPEQNSEGKEVPEDPEQNPEGKEVPEDPEQNPEGMEVPGDPEQNPEGMEAPEARKQFPDGDSPVVAAKDVQMETAGFYTVDLEAPVRLKKGQTFAVVVRIETPGETKPVAVEMTKDRFTESVTLEDRRTWVSNDGNVWENTQEVYGTNVCLKAYTREGQR